MDALFVEGALLPLRTGAALVVALAAGTLLGASGRPPPGAVGGRGLALGAAGAVAGAALGASLSRVADADALSLAALALAALACALVAAARAPASPIGAAALVGVATWLGAQAALARFLPGELPASVPVGAVAGLALATVLPAAAVRLAGALARAPGPRLVVAIGTRVLGSWIGAVALLLLALSLAGR